MTEPGTAATPTPEAPDDGARRRVRRRRWIRRLIVYGVVLLVVIPFVASFALTNPARNPGGGATPRSYGLTFESPTLIGQRGAELAAWVVRAEAARGTVVLSHGFEDFRQAFLPNAKWLHEAGFHVMLYDQRCHGRSTGDYCTLGRLESDDLGRVIDWCAANLAQPDPVVVWGVSMGATGALVRAAADPRIRAVIADSPYRNLDAVVSHYAWSYLRVPRWPIVPLMIAAMRVRTGAAVSDAAPDQVLDRLADCPVLFLAGQRDQSVRVDDVRWMAANKPGASHIRVFAHARHIVSYGIEPKARRPVVQFLDTVAPRRRPAREPEKARMPAQQR